MMVVLCHFLGIFLPGVVFGKDQHYDWERLIPGTPLYMLVSGHFAVCLFFVLSGFVLSIGPLTPGRRFEMTDLLAAVAKRLFRLLGIVFVTEIIGLVCWWQGWFLTQAAASRLGNSWLAHFWPKPLDADSAWSLLRGPFFYGAAFNPPLWTIALELYGSFLVFALLLLLTRFSRGRLPLLLLVLFLMGQLQKVLETCGYRSELIPSGQWMLLNGFVFGMIAAHLWHLAGAVQRFWAIAPLRWVWLLSGILFASYPYYAGATGTLYQHLPRLTAKFGGGYPMIGAFMLHLAVLAGWGRGLLQSKPARQLGRWSYAIYGTHFLIQPTLCCGLFLFLDDLGWSYPAIAGLCFFVMLPLVMLAASVLTRLVDLPSIAVAAWVGNVVRRSLRRAGMAIRGDRAVSRNSKT